MAKYERATGVVTAEEPDETTPETPEATPAPAPIPPPDGAPAVEEPALAEANGRIHTIDVPSLITDSTEARRLLSLLNEMEAGAISVISAVHFLLGVENRKGMAVGQYLFFSAAAHGMLEVRSHVAQMRGVLTGQILVDNQGEIVERAVAHR